MDTNTEISSFVDNKVTQDLYFTYLSKININNLTWNYEMFLKDPPSLTYIPNDHVRKIKQYMAGSYEAALFFNIIYSTNVNDEIDFIEIVKPLFDLESIFINEKNTGFSNVHIDNGEPIEIIMTAVPKKVIESNNDNVEKFMATYKLKYKKKGR